MIAGQCGGSGVNNASAGGNSANATAASAVDGEKVPQEKVPKWSKAAFQVCFQLFLVQRVVKG